MARLHMVTLLMAACAIALMCATIAVPTSVRADHAVALQPEGGVEGIEALIQYGQSTAQNHTPQHEWRPLVCVAA
jgi:predicted membrane-bound mannosyltransferase